MMFLIRSCNLCISLILILNLALSAQSSSEAKCSTDFYILEKELLSRSTNRFNLTKTFFPPHDPHPVVVKVTYVFEGSGETDVWFWSESMFYLIQPLEIFQYTSLFFSNLQFREKDVTITLGANCSDTGQDFLMILTQRLKLYSQSTTTAPSAASASINENNFAVAASMKEIKRNELISDFIKIWLHITLALFPLGTWLMLYICDPLHLLLGDHTWQKLEDEQTHGTIAALIQISIMFTTYVFILDWIALGATITNDLISYKTHSTFYLTTVTGMFIDTGAFLWVLFVLSKMFHWNCLYYTKPKHWNNPNSKHLLKKCDHIKKLLTATLIAPFLCIANHFYYIILAFLSDPFHAGFISIGHGISFLLYYFVFKQFYNRIVLQINRRRTSQEKEKHCVNIIAASNPDLRNGFCDGGELQLRRPKIRRKILRVPFNVLVVVLGLFIIGPLLVFYEAMIIALLVNLPLSKLMEDAPSCLYALYQGTGILTVALLTYSIILQPASFSFTGMVEKMAKELRIQDHYPKWSKFSNEEKVANVCIYLLRHKPIPSPVSSVSDLRLRYSRFVDSEDEFEEVEHMDRNHSGDQVIQAENTAQCNIQQNPQHRKHY